MWSNRRFILTASLPLQVAACAVNFYSLSYAVALSMFLIAFSALSGSMCLLGQCHVRATSEKRDVRWILAFGSMYLIVALYLGLALAESRYFTLQYVERSGPRHEEFVESLAAIEDSGR